MIVKAARRITEMLEVIQLPGGFAALRNKPSSLASFKLVSDLQQSGLTFRTILDGGANIGQFARAAASAFPDATIHSFEPLPELVDQLRVNLSNVPGWQVHTTALGDIDGETEFHRNAYSQSSSILPLDSSGDSLLRDKQQVTATRVKLARMDTIFAGQQLAGPVLLKLDLQGYELPALHGATNVLSKCSHLLLETVFQSAYEGEPLFDEVQAFVRTQGFRFCRPLNFARQGDGRVAQMDALFERADSGYGSADRASS